MPFLSFDSQIEDNLDAPPFSLDFQGDVCRIALIRSLTLTFKKRRVL